MIILIVMTCCLLLLFMPLFFRFVSKDDITGVTQLKASVQRGIRAKIVDQYPPLEEYINTICPKKENIVLVKW